MGFVEIIYKDGSGLRIEEGKIEPMTYDYCAVCREIKLTTEGDAGELGTFICHACLGWVDGKPAQETSWI